MVVCCIHYLIIYIRYISQCYPSHTPHSLLSLLQPPTHDRSRCVMFSSLYSCVLIVRLPLRSENMWCLVFYSCLSFLRMMVSSFIHVSAKDILFYGCIVFRAVYVPHFLYLVYNWWAFGLVPSLHYCEQCHSKHTCVSVLIVEWFIILWVTVLCNLKKALRNYVTEVEARNEQSQ